MPSPPLSERNQLRLLGALLVALTLGASVLGAYAVHLAMQFNPVLLPHEMRARLGLGLFFPQGWRFFTRNPQEGDLFPLARRDGAWVDISRQPNARAINLFGINRNGRAQGIEMGLVAAQLPPNAWVECKEEPTACLDRMKSAEAINTTPSPSLCGEIAIVQQEPTPWAWSRNHGRITMPSRVARLDVKCSPR